MKDRKRFVLSFWVFALAGCAAPASDAGEIDRQAVEAEITEFSHDFWDAWREGNAGLERAMAFFDDHPDFAYAAQGTVWRSLSEVTDTFRSAFQIVQSQTIEIQGTLITVLNQDTAYLMQHGAYAITDMNGVTSGMIPFAFSGFLVRTGSGWKVRGAHVSEPAAM